MNITQVPLEILEKVTLYMDNIWDLECWLVCAYILEEMKSIQLKRYQLTIENRGIAGERRVGVLLNTKFMEGKICKRKKRKFEGLFDNFLLVGDVEKRDLCFKEWRNIHNQESYEYFMGKYGDIWINKAPPVIQRKRNKVLTTGNTRSMSDVTKSEGI